ncbi:uncharacterized protein LOC115886145 [Sitophilus oryzae]|uniref:Uncharacterized protein LOC115886145 n=1 Tax=Sitophilus oryzae TaxID=7048 RepID=A0A6J2YD14_SITOR|nr:uncharacterized protein LOC115886145 [Sitophilus oryzae]
MGLLKLLLKKVIQNKNKLALENENLRRMILKNNNNPSNDLTSHVTNEVSVTKSDSIINLLKDKINDKDQLIEEITDKNNVLKQNIILQNGNLTLIKEKLVNLEKQKNQIEMKSFAQATKVTYNKFENTEIVPAIIVQCNKKEQINNVHNKTKQLLTTNKNIQYNKITRTKDKIIIKCNRSMDITETKELLGSISNDEISVEVEKKNNPRIKVINIDYDLGNENIENIKEDILIRNDLKDEADKFDIVYKYLNEDNKIWTIIVEMSCV